MMPVSRYLCIFINVGLGEAAKRNVGTGAGQIPDMTSFQSGSNGYGSWFRFPNGMLVQTGVLPSTIAGSGVGILFPTPFTVQPAYSLSPTGTSGIMVVAAGSSVTQINGVLTFSNTGAGLTNGVIWIAVGK
ncbi:gp53-like domain-containing protein [Escherichia coli]|uniref:gp53-like domain-containing protein n=1 Tax=Escherichia coli TaxID=562 RepID=UPI00406A2DDB